MGTFTIHLDGLGDIVVDDSVVVGKWDGSGKILLYNTPSLVGPAGPAGPAGSGSGSDVTYTHIQASAASVWTIAHGLGRHPSVTVVDSSGRSVYGDVNYTDSNTLVVSFSAAFAGNAYLN